MSLNVLLNTDSYKASHYLQYPPHTEYVSSYIESRGGAHDTMVFFGLQAFIKAHLQRPITMADIDEAEAVLQAHGLPFHRAGWTHIVKAHDGHLPIDIEAVPEGTCLPTQHVLCQVVNTDPQCYWLTSYLETALLRAIWYPCTVATRAMHIKHTLKHHMQHTAGHLEGLDFQLHDFGARGVSSEESASLGGMAHLLWFQGTDNLSGLMAARRFYGATMPGYSIPAAEHATMTAWGHAHEADAYQNMLQQFAQPNRMVAVVSDSYDLWHAIDHIWGKTLHDQVMSQGGTVVIRPDSGDPVAVVPRVIEALMQKFGATTNAVGYRVLPDCVRVIQGDGVSPEVIGQVLHAMQNQKLSAENIAFGMGAELLQKVHRDTLKFAMKASAVCVRGQWRPIFKAPQTDLAKQSKPGRLALIHAHDRHQTIPLAELSGRDNCLRKVFSNGQLLLEEDFATIRQRAASTGLV